RIRTPVGSSKMVARSRSHSSPGCVPSGVILTFCAQAGTPAAESPSASRLIPKSFICMTSSPGKDLALFESFGHVGRSIERRTIGLLFHIVGDKIIPLIDRFICRAAVDHGSIFLLSDEFLDAGLVLLTASLNLSASCWVLISAAFPGLRHE